MTLRPNSSCVCVNMCQGAHIHGWVHMGVEAIGWPQVASSITAPPYFLRQGLSRNLPLLESARLANQRLPELLLYCGCARAKMAGTWLQACLVGAGNPKLVLTLTWQSLYPLYSPAPQSSFKNTNCYDLLNAIMCNTK